MDKQKSKPKHNAIDGIAGTPNPEVLPVQHVVVTSPRSLFDKIKIFFDVVATVAIYLTLLLSWRQFHAADKKEQEASAALDIAQTARRTTEEAQNRIERHEEALAKLRIRLEPLAASAEISDLTLRADNGERAALLQLQSIGWHPRSNDAPATVDSAKRSAGRILAKYGGLTYASEGLQNLSESPCPDLQFDVTRTENDLKSRLFANRIQAIATIRVLQIYRLVPRLYELALTDPDLNIVQLAANTANNMLCDQAAHNALEGSNCERIIHGASEFITSPDRIRSDVERSWASCSNRLLHIKEKRWVSGKDAEGRGIVMPSEIPTTQQ